MTTDKELFDKLYPQIKSKQDYTFRDLGEEMMLATHRFTKEIVLMNMGAQLAWEIRDSHGYLAKEYRYVYIDEERYLTFPQNAYCNSRMGNANYYFHIGNYKDKLACISWMLQPDGRYNADEDGYGMTDDEEIIVTGYIDNYGKMRALFQEADTEKEKLLREEALKSIKRSEKLRGILKEARERYLQKIKEEENIPLFNSRQIYGKKMFITDLILVTLWSLLMCRYSLRLAPALPLLCLVRLGLCFEMKRKSSWTLLSAIAFALSYIGGLRSEWFLYPAKRLVYYAYAVIGHQSLGIELMQEDPSLRMMTIIYIIMAAISLWLVGLPLLVGWGLKNVKRINWKGKLLWVMLGGWSAISILLISQDLRAGLILSGILFFLIPPLYWIIYDREGRSLVEVIAGDANIHRYLTAFSILVIYLTIGYQPITLLKVVGLLLLPIITFYLLGRWSGLTPVPTRYCACLSLAAILFLFMNFTPLWFKIIILAVIGCLTLYVAISLFIKRKIWLGITTTIITFVGNAVILGYNPYTTLQTDEVTNYTFDYTAPIGYYITVKEDKVGLRDRMGEVFPAKYDQLETLDINGRYVLMMQKQDMGKRNNRYGVFDIWKRRFIINPSEVHITQIMSIGEKKYKLFDENMEVTGILCLPGYNGEWEERIWEPVIRPIEDIKTPSTKIC